ncbi:MAG: insulinase family protein [Methanomassiliicoccales archaeon]|nr:insulinase family protein [Methanomassiliicoccales archaeon]
MKEEIVSFARTRAGIPVVVERLPYARSVALSVYVRVGSRDEPKGREGLAHLLEHVMFKGTKKRTSKETSELIEAAGGELNGYTGKESTCYYVVSLDKTLDTAEDILADLMLNPSLDDEAVDNEKKVVAEEIRMLKDEPDTYIHHLFSRALWDGHPMASVETGEIEGIASLSADDVRDYFKERYRPHNFVVAACGNVKLERVEKWASETFDPRARPGRGNERVPPSTRSLIEEFPREGDQAYVGMGFPGLNAAHPDRYVQTLLSALLGAGTSSRLYQKVREDRGLAYSIYALSQPFSDCGMFGVFFSTSSKNMETVIRLVSSELLKIKAEGLERGELTRAKRLIEGILVRKLESSESKMFHLGEFFLLTGKAPTEAAILAAFERVTEDDIIRVGRELIDRRKLCIALHASEKTVKTASQNLGSLDL